MGRGPTRNIGSSGNRASSSRWTPTRARRRRPVIPLPSPVTELATEGRVLPHPSLRTRDEPLFRRCQIRRLSSGQRCEGGRFVRRDESRPSGEQLPEPGRALQMIVFASRSICFDFVFLFWLGFRTALIRRITSIARDVTDNVLFATVCYKRPFVTTVCITFRSSIPSPRPVRKSPPSLILRFTEPRFISHTGCVRRSRSIRCLAVRGPGTRLSHVGYRCPWRSRSHGDRTGVHQPGRRVSTGNGLREPADGDGRTGAAHPHETHIIPYFWVRGADATDVEAAFEAHDGVVEVVRIDSVDSEYLMRAKWESSYFGILSRRARRGERRRSLGRRDQRWLELRGPRGESGGDQRVRTLCQEHDIPIGSPPSTRCSRSGRRHQLTDAQRGGAGAGVRTRVLRFAPRDDARRDGVGTRDQPAIALLAAPAWPPTSRRRDAGQLVDR